MQLKGRYGDICHRKIPAHFFFFKDMTCGHENPGHVFIYVVKKGKVFQNFVKKYVLRIKTCF